MSAQSSPRGNDVTALLRLYERQYAEKHTSQRQLRQDNQFLNTYTEEQWLRLHNDWAERGTEISYRTKVDTMLGHYMLLRSSNRLDMELADLFVLPMENEGVRGSTPMLFFLLKKGKVLCGIGRTC
jgi:hypothetical protein